MTLRMKCSRKTKMATDGQRMEKNLSRSMTIFQYSRYLREPESLSGEQEITGLNSST